MFKDILKNNSGLALGGSKGSTLLETIIYIGLFAIIITGGMIGAYQIIQSTDHTANKTTLEQDANFILRKMDWALTGATLLATPNPQPKLVITRSPSPVTFRLSGDDFQKDGAPLNGSGIKISNLVFTLIAAGGQTGVTASFTATTIDDKLSQTFSMTKYLRQ